MTLFEVLKAERVSSNNKQRLYVVEQYYEDGTEVGLCIWKTWSDHNTII